MIPRRRLRRVLNWSAITACVILFSLWIVSEFWTLNYTPRFGNIAGIGFRYGTFYFNRRPVAPSASDIGFSASSNAEDDAYWAKAELPHTAKDRRYYGFCLPSLITVPEWESLRLPLWILVLAIGVPWGLLTWRERRIRPGHCRRCGYDLTANISGRCPECGTVATQPPAVTEPADRR